ncbi:AlwI family type II restriction endonuclease [Ligilactobacillus cholophilus]|uniref:AlwI family type II restriction endonuclease n=1 Tax=Ligilactobacillus cholophilus TaxID=3050131 RepID=UPI0025B01D3F|nr:AlwI family type II restriction endonuclease [Ligilactobacillus cholophilus]
MTNRRKPIAFDTTLRNPERIPQFVSILEPFEGKILNDKTALYIEAEVIRNKLFQPTKATMGEYTKEYIGKFHFIAKDQSEKASQRVTEIFKRWDENDAGTVSVKDIIYLLENTITKHKEKNWKGGWESRLWTQYRFLNELGFIYFIKGEPIKISENGHLMIHEYSNGIPKKDTIDISYEQSAFLIAFSKYQINNPYRKNTISVNFFPLVLNTIKYLDEMHQKHGISKQDISFIIAWNNNDYIKLGEYIYNFRKKYGYKTSDQMVYEYAMNLLDDSTENKMIPANKEFIEKEKKNYKMRQIMIETPDEVIRKLRLTMLVSLKGIGNFIDINHNENDKITYIIENMNANQNFSDENQYFEYMGSIEEILQFKNENDNSEKEFNEKITAIKKWSKELKWNVLKEELVKCIDKRQTNNNFLKYINEPTRLEFLIAITVKKALPEVKVIPHYKADDEGIPYNTAPGGVADIDVYEDDTHALVEPTISKSRSFQSEHEIPSIRNHIQTTIETDKKSKEVFALFIALPIINDTVYIADFLKEKFGFEIYLWEADDFAEFSRNVKSIKDYKLIRSYANAKSYNDIKNP